MTRPTRKSALATIALLSVASATIAPTYVHAQRPHDNNRVWVVDNVTAQASCTVQWNRAMNAVPCPAGALQVLHLWTMDESTAQAEHRPYISTTATRDDVNRFAINAYASPTEASPRVRPLATCNFSSYSDTFRTTLPNVKSTVSFTMNYTQDTSCNYHSSDYVTDLVSSPYAWLNSVVYVADGNNNNVYDTDGANPVRCDALPHDGAFSGNAIAPGLPDGVRTFASYSSGSNCTSFDTYDLAGFKWGEYS